MKIANFRNSAYVNLLADVDLKNNWWLNSMTKYATPLQISSHQIKIDNFRNLAYVDLLADVDLKNNWLVEFSDRKYKSSSNFKSIR